MRAIRAAALCWLVLAATALAAPPEFTAADQQRLDRARAELRELRERFLTDQLDSHQLAALAAQAQPLVDTVVALQAEREQWQAHLEGREAAIGTPSLVAATEPMPASSPQLGRDSLLEAFTRFQHLEARRRETATAPAAGEWRELAARLQPLLARTIGFDPSGDDPFLWRALLIHGQCNLFASVEDYRKGDHGAQAVAYRTGLESLERVLLSFQTARSLHREGADGCELVPEQAPPFALAELAGATDRSLYPVLRQRPTSEVAAQSLSEFCPWGLRLYTVLENAGFTRGLDWRILLPYGGAELQLASVATLGGAVPPTLQGDMNAARRGLIRHLGRELPIRWERQPAAPTYTVWFASPALEAGNASLFVTWGLRAVKLLTGGPLDLAADEAMGALVDVIGHEYGADSKVYAASGFAVNLNNYGLDSDFLLDGKDFASGKPPKEALKGLLGWLEEQTLKLSFDGIDPGNAAVRSQVGHPSSYDGSPVPAILLRGDLLGFEAVPPDRYRRTWGFIRFHQLDPRRLAGGGYDLSRKVLERLPGAPAVLGADPAAAAAAWPLLPGDLGSRLLLSDFTPQIQVLRLDAPRSAFDQWRQLLGEGETLVALLQAEPGSSPTLAWHEVDDGEISFTITNELQLQRDGTISNIFFAEESKGKLRSTDPRHPYTIRIAVCGKSAPRYEPGALLPSSAVDWQHPRRILAERTGRFLSRGGLPHNGVINYPRKGCEVLEMALDAPAPVASAPQGRSVGFVDQAWFEEWTGRHFRFAGQAGGRDALEVKALAMSCSGGSCTLTGGDYAIVLWTEAGQRGGQQGFQETIAALTLEFTTAAADEDRVSGSYLARGRAATRTLFPALMASGGRQNHPQVSVEGAWVAERVAGSDGVWTVNLEPHRATLPATMVPVAYRLEEE